MEDYFETLMSFVDKSVKIIPFKVRACMFDIVLLHVCIFMCYCIVMKLIVFVFSIQSIARKLRIVRDPCFFFQNSNRFVICF